MATGPKIAPSTAERDVAFFIEERRRSAGMSQSELAELIGISQPQVSRILAGSRAMTLTEMFRACDALGLVASDVMRDAGL